ncbi:MAG: hypothetical protein PWQ06_2799 [Anaerophaga sp.]|nr:hypothetical protein [Anaerophaga sp.]
MDLTADKALPEYFSENICKIESWFNIITPNGKTITDLKTEIAELRTKNWRKII